MRAPQDSKTLPEITLDQFDLKILSILQRCGRMSKAELATKIGLSASPCLMRLKKLEDAGYISGYHAEINISRLANTTTVVTEIELQSHRSDDFDKFEAAIMTVDEIIECNATGGGIDYYIKMVVSDIEHYQAIVEYLLSKDLSIARYYTYIVTKPIKNSQYLPLDKLLLSKHNHTLAGSS